MNQTAVSFAAGSYKYILKPIFFKFDPEFVHTRMTSMGELMGRHVLLRKLTSALFQIHDPKLSQEFWGIKFASPLGLSAGFDYEARLTQITYTLGFGFHTVGTITNTAYGGNPRPMLGRLPKSRSLMVNKGFKNDGAEATLRRLEGLDFNIPVGVSIGRTNNADLKQKESVKDIINAFVIFEKSGLKHAYYELNISCPNLFGDVTFYTKNNLEELLSEIDKLHIKKPVFVKMPIDRTDTETKVLLDVIVDHSPKAVIFGNLQKDRNHPTLLPDEVMKFKKGNFSGKPTYERSNELISYAYKHYGKKLLVIGCGGVFNADDAYEKFKRGASLVQMITGMIFDGPQTIAQINQGIISRLENDGAKNITEIIGSAKV